MKRIPKILILSLMLGLVFVPPSQTFAAIKDKGTTWWSVEELLEFSQEVELEKTAECGDDADCRMEFSFNMIERGPKYSALNNLLEAQIWVTSVNPAKETIKVLYFDDEMMLKRMGIDEKIHLEHLYVGWVEEWSGQIFNYDHDRFTGGEIAGNHPMYDGSSAIDGEDWIPAWEEYELSVAGSNLVDNLHGRIDYAVFAKNNMFNAQGSFDYSNCLSATDYQVGMECKMYVSGDQWVSYFPPREQLNEQDEQDIRESGQDIAPEKEAQSRSVTKPYCSLEEAIRIIIESEEIDCYPTKAPYSYYEQEWIKMRTSAEVSATEELSHDPALDSAPVLDSSTLALGETITIKAPETGKAGDYESSPKSNLEMPWWFILLNIIGAALLVWWFMPTTNEKIRKSIKNSKKRY